MEAVGQQIPEVIIQEAMALANTAVCDIINTQRVLLKQINEKRAVEQLAREQLANSTGAATGVLLSMDAGIYKVADKMLNLQDIRQVNVEVEEDGPQVAVDKDGVRYETFDKKNQEKLQKLRDEALRGAQEDLYGITFDEDI